MRKLKLLLMAFALLGGASSVWAQPTASAPSVGNTYYLYNPTTKLFMTTNANLSFVRPIGSAWKLENAAEHEGWITLRLKDSDDEGCGYFWGKWWANDPAANSASYSDERVFKLVQITGNNYKLKSYAWGSSDAYIYINNGTEGDGSYRLACNSHEQGSLDEGYITWQFISEEDYDAYMSMDYTSFIKNNDFNTTANWTLGGEGNKQAHGNTAIEYWHSTAAGGTFDYHQDVTVPAGKYVLRAAMYNSTNGETVKNENVDTPVTFDPAGQCGVYGTSDGTTQYANVTVDGTTYNIYTTDALLVPDGNLRLGFKNSTTMTARWFGTDWIQLTCVDYCLSYVAEALPDGTAMTANKWYYFNIPVDAEYTLSCDNLSNIVYTTDGSILVDEASVTTTFASNTVPLTAGSYYVKSSSAQTLAVAANTFSYNVGSATTDITEIQTGYTVTVTWADASTNDPDANITTSLSGVTFNDAAVSCTSTANGFTFEVPGNLTAGTEYTLAIPAGAFGYTYTGGSTYNEAQNITLTTPAVLDGTYYLYDATNKLFVSCGANWGSRATVDEYGIPLKWENSTKMLSLKSHPDVHFFFDKDDHAACWIYTDGASSQGDNRKFEFTSNGAGKYYLQDYAKAVYITHDNSAFTVPTTTVGSAAVWTILTKAQHDDIVAAYPNANKTNVISAANISTTAADFETYLSNNYAEVDKTSKIGTAKFADSKGDWTWTQVRSRDGQPAYSTSGCNVYEATGTYSQTITGLDKGIYKVTVQGFERAAGPTLSNTLGGEGYEIVTAYLSANDEKAQLKSWYSDKTDENNPNDPAQVAAKFDDNKYINEVYVYVDDSGELEIKLVKPSYQAGNWVFFNNFTLTYYERVEKITVESTVGYSTYASDNDLDFTNVSGLTAYKASIDELDDSKVVLTPVTTVKASEGVVLKGDAGTYDVPVTTGATELEGNLLKRGTGAAVSTEADGYKNYVLSTDDNDENVGFYQAGGETVPTHRAYLQATANLARLSIVFEDEATGISTLKNADFKVEGYFDLQGRRVENPTKGLYIKDGKVVSVK